jgi:hypothetical protein
MIVRMLRCNHHLVSVGAPRAFEPAEVETHASRRDAREHHERMTLWASWTMDVGVYIVGQEIRVLHDASLKREAGAQRSLSPVVCL